MAVKPAPDSVMVSVREIGTETVMRVHTIDAKELIDSGAYERVADVVSDSASKKTAFAPADDVRVRVREVGTDTVIDVLPIDAAELVKSGAYERVTAPALAIVEASAESAEPTEQPLPPVESLAAVLSAIEDADELLTMEARDERVEAKPYYEARFNELASNATRQ